MTVDIDVLRARLVGYAFPGGRCLLSPHEAWIGQEALQADPRAPHLDPVWALVVGLRGMGLSLDELFTLVGSSRDDGVMFGELTLRIHAPLVAARDYAVSGRIDDVQRRVGRRAGTFDALAFTLELTHDAVADAELTCSFLFPRRSA